jgi:hypothetical protein
MAQRLTCDPRLTTILFGAGSAISDVSKAQRVARGSTRRAVMARDGGCRAPGCTRPASYTELHHVTHWKDGGRTEVGTLVCLCYRHHWMVHEGGWSAYLTDEGRFVMVPPRHRTYPLARGPGDREAA